MDDFDRNIILRAEGIKRELDVSLSQLDIPLLKDRRNINDVVAKALAKAVGAFSVGVIEYRITPKPGTRLISLEEGDHFNYDSFLEFLSRNGLSADSTNTVLCSQLTGIYEDPSITGHATAEDFGLKYIPLSNLYGDQIFVLRNNKPIVIYENMDSIKRVIGGSFLCPPEGIDLDSLVEGYISRKRANFEQRKQRFVAGGNRIGGTEFESFWRAYSSIYFPIQANYGGRNIILGVVGINDIPGWDYKKPPSPETMDVLQSIVNRVSHILIAFESFYKERQLNKIIAHLAVARAMEGFIGSVCHEAGPQVARVVESAQLLLETNPRSPVIRGKIDDIADAGLKLGKLLENMGAVVQGKVNLELGDLYTTLRKVGQYLGNYVSQETDSRVRFQTEIPEGIQLANYNTPVLSSLLQQLVQNSIYFLENSRTVQPTITLYATTDNQKLCFGVRDNGPGIHSDKKQIIFDPGYSERADRDQASHGFGLVAVSQMVKGHNGKVYECGTFGKGADFRVELPLFPR